NSSPTGVHTATTPVSVTVEFTCAGKSFCSLLTASLIALSTSQLFGENPITSSSAGTAVSRAGVAVSGSNSAGNGPTSTWRAPDAVCTVTDSGFSGRGNQPWTVEGKDASSGEATAVSG